MTDWLRELKDLKRNVYRLNTWVSRLCFPASALLTLRTLESLTHRYFRALHSFLLCKSPMTLTPAPPLFVCVEDRWRNMDECPWMNEGMRDGHTVKKQTDQEIKWWMRSDDEDWSRRCICSRAIHFPISQPSHLLNLPPLWPRCVPQCVPLQSHFLPRTLPSQTRRHRKMTKPKPRQNFLFHSPEGGKLLSFHSFGLISFSCGEAGVCLFIHYRSSVISPLCAVCEMYYFC